MFDANSASRNPWIAFFLSLLFPGLGHLYLGQRMGAFIYSAMGAGLWILFFSSRSSISRLSVLIIFPFVYIPVLRDVLAAAQGKKAVVTGNESRIYVIWMLCCVGPFAMPLLWQNKKFSVPVKVIWSVVVLSIVVLFFLAAAVLGRSYDELVQALS